MSSFWGLPDRALLIILDDYVELKDVCAVNATLSRKNNAIVTKKFQKIFATLTPRDVVLKSTSLLGFLVRTKIPVGGLKIDKRCLDYSSETSARETERLMIELVPHLTPSRARPFQVTFSVAEMEAPECSTEKELEIMFDFVTDDLITGIGKLKNLQYLVLRGCREITDHGVVLLSWECPELRYIDISHTHYPEEENITDKSLIALSFGCKKLETVIIEELDVISDTGIVCLSKGCRNLKELNAFYCDRLGDTSICSIGKHCGELEKINLMYSDISDEAIKSLADGCPRLLNLNVAFCDTITDLSLLYLAPKCQQLHSINLRKLEITDDSIVALCNHLQHSLHTIDLTQCSLLRDDSIYALCKPTLKHLSLPLQAQGIMFSDGAVTQLARSSPTLEYFSAHVYFKTTDTLAIHFANYCPLLSGHPYDEIRNMKLTNDI